MAKVGEKNANKMFIDRRRRARNEKFTKNSSDRRKERKQFYVRNANKTV